MMERMPTTLPSPVDRGEFQFVAVDAAGAVWHWIDQDMVWARQRPEPEPAARDPEGGGVVH